MLADADARITPKSRARNANQVQLVAWLEHEAFVDYGEPAVRVANENDILTATMASYFQERASRSHLRVLLW